MMSVQQAGNANTNPFYNQGNLRMGDERHTVGGYFSGRCFAKDNSGAEKFRGFCQRAGNFLYGAGKPALKLAANLLIPGYAIYSLVKHIKGLIAAKARGETFSSFQDANTLKMNDPEKLTRFAREAGLCSISSNDRGCPGRGRELMMTKYVEIPEDTIIRKMSHPFSGEDGVYAFDEMGNPFARAESYGGEITGWVAINRLGRDVQENYATYKLGILDDSCGVIGGEPNANLEAIEGDCQEVFDSLPTDIQQVLTNNKGAFIDHKTGLVATLMLEKTEGRPKIHVCFAGTGAAGLQDRHVGHDLAAMGLTDRVDSAMHQASALVRVLKESCPDHDIECKGFSMGGGIAMYAGIDNDVKTVALCPAPMSPRCQKELGQQKLRQAAQAGDKFTTLTNKKCWVTDHPVLQKLARLWECLTGKYVPRMICQGYHLNETPTEVQKYLNREMGPDVGGLNIAKMMSYHNFASESWQEFAGVS